MNRRDDEQHFTRSQHERDRTAHAHDGKGAQMGQVVELGGPREPYRPSGSGGRSIGAAGYGHYRGEGQPGLKFSRARWSPPEDADSAHAGGSLYSESQYGLRASKPATGANGGRARKG